jgi:hypothetical protein
MKETKTERGFSIIKFKDYYNANCSLQQSSIVLSDEGFENPGTSAIWLGVDDADPKIMGKNGWENYYIPEEVLLTTRMHLNRDQVKDLVKHLNSWLKNGCF